MKKVKILIAGHDPVDLEFIRHELTSAEMDYEYKVANNEPAFVNDLAEFAPDIILANYTYPSFDGASAFRIKQKMAPDIPFIFVSGTIADEKSIELIKTGVTDYVMKERLSTLALKVKRALQESLVTLEKNRFEQAFKNERARFVEIILQSPSSIGVLSGPEHIFEMVNPFYLRLIGKTMEIIGKKVREVLPEVVDQGFIAILDKVYLSGEPFFANEKPVKLDRYNTGILTDNFVNIVYQPYRDDDGNIKGILFFTIDVTEQVLSRRSTEESENRFRAIIEKSAEIITLSARDGRILYISPSVTNTFGYCRDDIALAPAFMLMHPNDRREFARKWFQLLKVPGASFDAQVRLLHKKGTWVWCEGVFTNMLHEPGVHAVLSNFRDVSEKKVVDQQLQFNSNNLSALINNTRDLLWSVDRDLDLITFNRPFAKRVADDTGQNVAKGSHALSFLHNDQQYQRYQQFYKRALAGEVFTEIEHTPLPIELWSEISFYPIRNGELVTGTACHSRDITALKRTEKNLLQSEKQYRQILETSEEGIWMIDEDNVVTFVNDKICEILGYTRQEMIGRTNISFKDEEGQKAGLEDVARRRKGVKETYETTFLTKSGKKIWVRMAANPVWNEWGSYGGGLAMVTDITKDKKAADEMTRLTNRLLLATKSAAMGIWEWDIVNDRVEFDQAMFQLYDLKESDFGSVYDAWLATLHWEDKARVNEDIRLAVEGKAPYDTEFRIVWGDSSVHYMKAKGITEADAQGKIVKLTGVNWDITTQKEREQQLKLLESVTTNTTDSVLITKAEPFDAPGPPIIYVNDAFTKMTGYSSAELIGKTPRLLQGPGSDETELRRFSDAIRKWEPCEITILNYKKNGEEFWVNFSVSPVMNDRGWYTHWISISKDVTARKSAELRLKELNEDLRRQAKELAISNAELEQFAYVASHDLQEPLRMITGFLTQLDKKYGDVIDEKGKTYIDFAVDGARRMRQIILDLLEFSRIGRTEDSLEIIDLNQLLAEIKILFRKQIAEKSAEIIVDELPKVEGHMSPLRQVFHNLIGNALKYSERDRPARIHVSVKDLNDAWQFSVCDNGIGIESEYFEKIFIIFQRLHRKEEFSGTGMGLAITKKIVDTWAGRIWLESEPGKGSTFHFTFFKSFSVHPNLRTKIAL